MRNALFRFRKLGDEIKPLEPDLWAKVIADWPEGILYVELQDEKRMRSNRQNRYWYGVVVPVVGQCWMHEMGWAAPPSVRMVHGALVRSCLGTVQTPLGPERVSSAELTTEQFTDLIDWAREYARTKYKVEIPEPGE